MAARAAQRRGASRWLVPGLKLSGLAVIGFALGAVVGLVWQDPGLVASFALGRTVEVAWNGAQAPLDVAAPPPAAGPPAAAPPLPPAPAEPPAASRPEPREPGPAGSLAVQVGAFADHGSADELAQRLRSKGFPVSVTPGTQGGSARWRVRVGPFASREQAERAAGRLKRDERLPTWVLDEDRI